MPSIFYLSAHQQFSRKLPQSLNFNEYYAPLSLEPDELGKVANRIDYGKHARIWIKSLKPGTWVYKVSYSFYGVTYLDLSSGHIHGSYEGAREDAIARCNAIDTYIEELSDRLNSPLELAPIYTKSGYFIDNEQTDRRVIAWYRLNMPILGNDPHTRLYDVLVERTRLYRLRINALWLSFEFGINRLTLKRDASPSAALYYIYGVSYGLLGDQYCSLADTAPF